MVRKYAFEAVAILVSFAVFYAAVLRPRDRGITGAWEGTADGVLLHLPLGYDQAGNLGGYGTLDTDGPVPIWAMGLLIDDSVGLVIRPIPDIPMLQFNGTLMGDSIPGELVSDAGSSWSMTLRRR
jgi:hypothetical protein